MDLGSNSIHNGNSVYKRELEKKLGEGDILRQTSSSGVAPSVSSVPPTINSNGEPLVKVVKVKNKSESKSFKARANEFRSSISRLFTGGKSEKSLLAEKKQTQLRNRAKVEFNKVNLNLTEKKATLQRNKVEQVKIMAAQPKKPPALTRLRNFAHTSFGVGQKIEAQSPTPPSSETVLKILDLNQEKRTLVGEIAILSEKSAKLKAQFSKPEAAKQTVSYWGEKIFRGLSRRGGMGRAGQIEAHTIPSSPILPIRVVEDSINALRSVKNVFSNMALRKHIRGLEKMGLSKLGELNSQIDQLVLAEQTKNLRKTPGPIIANLAQHPEIRVRLMNKDSALSQALDGQHIDTLLADPMIQRILSQDPEALDTLKQSPEANDLRYLLEEKKILVEKLRPVLEMKAQLDLKREQRLIGMNLYKVGTTFVDVVQTSIGIAQIFTTADPTKTASITVGAIKIALIIPTFPIDVAIIRSNLKDAAVSLSNLSVLRNSFSPRSTIVDPEQKIASRIRELVKSKDFNLKRELEMTKEEAKSLDTAIKLMKKGKTAEVNQLISSGKFDLESQYILKPELRIMDAWIKNSEQKGQLSEEQRKVLSDLREMLVDASPQIAIECFKLSYPDLNIDELFQALQGAGQYSEEAAKTHYTNLLRKTDYLKKQIKDHDPTQEILDLQAAASALRNEDNDALKELLPGLSLQSQQAIRPGLKAIDDRLQALATEGEESTKEFEQLKVIRNNILLDGGLPEANQLAGLSQESQLAILGDDPFKKALLEVDRGTKRMQAKVRQNPNDRTASQELTRLQREKAKIEVASERTKEVTAVLNKGKNLFLDEVEPYMKQRLRMKRITEWIQVASDLLAIASTVASVAAFALLLSTGWGGIPAFAVVVLLLSASTVVRYGGSLLVDQILKGQARRHKFLQAVERGQVNVPTNRREWIDQGLRRAGLRGSLMDKREFFPAIYSQIEEELKDWDSIKASGQEEKTLAFTMFHLVQDYLPEKLPVHVDAKRYAQMLVSNEGLTRDTFANAIGTGMLHHDLSRLTPRKMINLAKRS